MSIRTVRRSNTLRHSFIAEGVLHPRAEARQGRTNVRREAVESLDEPWHTVRRWCRKECVSVRSLWASEGNWESIEEG